MSWNIQTPGDYINGPLTVAGQQTLNNLLAIRGTPTFPLSGVGLELFYSPTNLNSNIYSYNRTTSGWAELVFGSSNTIFQINGTSKVAINSTGLNVGNAPNANSRAWALQGFGYINGGDGNGIEYRNSGTGNSGYITNDNDRLNFNFISGILISQGNVRIASGNGIDFSLSPNAAGATSEILNDYEEGTWTPVVADANTGGNTGTCTINSAKYTKIGRVVSVECDISGITTTGMTAGNGFNIRGLPFVPVNGANGNFYTYRVGRHASTVSSSVYAPGGVTALQFYLYTASSGTADLRILVSDIVSTTSQIIVSVTYTV